MFGPPLRVVVSLCDPASIEIAKQPASNDDEQANAARAASGKERS